MIIRANVALGKPRCIFLSKIIYYSIQMFGVEWDFLHLYDQKSSKNSKIHVFYVNIF